MSIQEIQEVSLEILVAIDEFCHKKGLSYSLAYGTLIGAVRHKGFIPWDDDIDINMPRMDFNRFIKEFSLPGLGISNPYERESYIAYVRVYDKNKTFAVNNHPYMYGNNGGVWVDIFPADGADDDFAIFSNKIKRQKWLFNRQQYLREPKAAFCTMPTLKKKIGLFSRKVIRVNGAGLSSVIRQMTEMAVEIPFGSTNHWSQLCCMDNMHHLIEDFEYTVPMFFEGYQFQAMNGYDRVLRTLYGDYMQLPPVSKRVLHSSNVKFYWK